MINLRVRREIYKIFESSNILTQYVLFFFCVYLQFIPVPCRISLPLDCACLFYLETAIQTSSRNYLSKRNSRARARDSSEQVLAGSSSSENVNAMAHRVNSVTSFHGISCRGYCGRVMIVVVVLLAVVAERGVSVVKTRRGARKINCSGFSFDRRNVNAVRHACLTRQKARPARARSYRLAEIPKYNAN